MTNQELAGRTAIVTGAGFPGRPGATQVHPQDGKALRKQETRGFEHVKAFFASGKAMHEHCDRRAIPPMQDRLQAVTRAVIDFEIEPFTGPRRKIPAAPRQIIAERL